MASSPTVQENAIASEAAPARLPIVPLVVAMVVAVFLCVALIGGAMFYLVRSGRLPLQKDTTVVDSAAKPAAAVTGHAMPLEPMVANLADTGGAAYLKLSLTLRIADAAGKKDAAEKTEKAAKGGSEAEAAVRDTVLTVVGRQTAEGLLAADGKERLKAALKAALAERNPELKVMDLYFTDFLVQR